jgi:type 1 glutamine amidotransferase
MPTKSPCHALHFCLLAFFGLIFASAAVAPGALLGAEPAGAATSTKILLVASQPDHLWASHMYEHECNLLAKCLENTRGVQTTVSVGWPTDDKKTEGAKAIVFYCKHAGDILFDESRRSQCERLLSQGAGLTAIHWSTGADVKYGPLYLDALGGWFNRAHSGLKTGDAPLTKADPKHPIGNGWKEWQIHDEFYLDLRFHEDAKPLLTVKVDDRDQIVGWTIERRDSNGGRSFGTTLGHFHDNFARSDFRRMLVNGILWTAHLEIPAGGANVDVDDKYIKLPPRPPDAK